MSSVKRDVGIKDMGVVLPERAFLTGYAARFVRGES